MLPKYQFFEIVKVKTLGDREGCIAGMAQDDDGVWGYAVFVYEYKRVWDVREDELTPTGKMDKRENFYDGTSIKVRVDPETGEGDIVE